MAKEFFKAHFFPADYGRRRGSPTALNYYLAALFFNAFPLPQREAGARQTLRYIGHVLGGRLLGAYLPRGPTHRRRRHRPLSARHRHDRVTPRRRGRTRSARRARQSSPSHVAYGAPGRVRVAFGSPFTLNGDDYAALARRVEEAVRSL